MTTTISKQACQAQKVAKDLRQASPQIIDDCLEKLIRSLLKYKKDIQEINQQEIKKAQKKHSKAFIERLELNDQRFEEMIQGIQTVKELPHPCGEILEQRQLTNGAKLQKVSVPLGCIAIIYEARPNVTIDAAILCLKSLNSVILKGGSASLQTNRALAKALHQALEESHLPPQAVTFINSDQRQDTHELLQQSQYIDILIPRGGPGLIKAVVENTKIPLLYHADGLCHTYVDASAEIDMAIKVTLNAKTNHPATCCATETLLVHQDIATEFLPKLASSLAKAQVELRCDQASYKILQKTSTPSPLACQLASNQDWDTEHLALILNLAIVDSLDQALTWIDRHSSKHTEAIIAKDKPTIQKFLTQVDSAAVMVNCSTRLHDGQQFGLGAEMGIATGKLHARGPVGLKELTTYQYRISGPGILRK